MEKGQNSILIFLTLLHVIFPFTLFIPLKENLMENGDQIQSGLPHLRQSLSTRTHFPATLPQPFEPYFAHINMAPLAPYHEPFMLNDGMAMPSGHNNIFPSATLFGVEMEGSGSGWSFGNSRWPRQETLTLLEIRIRLDSKFKEEYQKGPLWDEVSRLMAEEYGYQRSGKKCREKFENLYKYYKKTKQRKAAGRQDGGRQDGSKNYRFFRQLELLYGETSNQSSKTLICPNPNNATDQENHQRHSLQEEKPSDQSLSFSNASESQTSSSENNNDDVSAIGKKGWKTEVVKEFVEKQMNKLMYSQDVWMERMLKNIEDKDQERISKVEELRKKETALFDKEHGFRVKERACAQARDGALMELLKKINRNRWTEHEISSLIQLRTSLEARFQENNGTGYSKEVLWEEIEAKMGSLGYERGAVECKAKWDSYS